MKLVNATAEEFVTLFGQEGLDMLAAHEGNVYLAKEGMFPKLEKIGKVGGCVVPVHPETLEILPAEGAELAMILYPENIIAESAMMPESKRPRYLTSVVAHELTHVKQVEAGRLTVKEWGVTIWEGQEYQLDMSGYVEFPWEREAYMTQFTFLLGSEERAEQAYQMLNQTFTPETAGLNLSH